MIQLGMNPAGFLKGLCITVLPCQIAEEKVVWQNWEKINLCVWLCMRNVCVYIRQTTQISNQYVHGIFIPLRAKITLPKEVKNKTKQKSQLKKHWRHSWHGFRNWVCKETSWSLTRLSSRGQWLSGSCLLSVTKSLLGWRINERVSPWENKYNRYNRQISYSQCWVWLFSGLSSLQSSHLLGFG